MKKERNRRYCSDDTVSWADKSRQESRRVAQKGADRQEANERRSNHECRLELNTTATTSKCNCNQPKQSKERSKPPLSLTVCLWCVRRHLSRQCDNCSCCVCCALTVLLPRLCRSQGRGSTVLISVSPKFPVAWMAKKRHYYFYYPELTGNKSNNWESNKFGIWSGAAAAANQSTQRLVLRLSSLPMEAEWEQTN